MAELIGEGRELSAVPCILANHDSNPCLAMDEPENYRAVISVTPDVIQLEGGVRRTSTGEKNYNGSLSFHIGDEKTSPQCFRSYVGSCHDNCKYGRNDTSKHHFLHRSWPSNIIQDKEQNLIENLNLGEINNRPLTKSRASPQLKFELSDRPKVKKKALSPAEESGVFEKQVNTKFEMPKKALSPEEESGVFEKQVNTKFEMPSPFHKRIVSVKPVVISTFPENDVNQVKSLLKTTLHSKLTPHNSEIIKQKGMPPANVIAILKPDVTASHVKKSAASVKLDVIKRKASSSVETSNPSAKFQVLKQTVSAPLKRTGLSSATITRLKRRLNQETKIINTVSISEIREKKIWLPPSASSFLETHDWFFSMKPRKNRKTANASPMKSRGKVGKTGEDLAQTEEETHGPISETQTTECKVEISREDKRVHRRTATIHPIESVAPHKLMFKRGKVLDLQPETTGPRRLRFKQGRVAVENPNANSEVWNGSVKGPKLSSLVSDECSSEAQSVQLRRQNMLTKKDSQFVYNQVIEETATKLVETRKSKVKALVGAFETVISLHVSKPAPTI